MASNRLRPTGRPFLVTREELSTTWRIRADNNGTPFRMNITPKVIWIVFEQDMVLINAPVPQLAQAHAQSYAQAHAYAN